MIRCAARQGWPRTSRQVSLERPDGDVAAQTADLIGAHEWQSPGPRPAAAQAVSISAQRVGTGAAEYLDLSSPRRRFAAGSKLAFDIEGYRRWRARRAFARRRRGASSPTRIQRAIACARGNIGSSATRQVEVRRVISGSLKAKAQLVYAIRPGCPPNRPRRSNIPSVRTVACCAVSFPAVAGTPYRRAKPGWSSPTWPRHLGLLAAPCWRCSGSRPREGDRSARRRPRHGRNGDRGRPLHAARAAEVTSLAGGSGVPSRERESALVIRRPGAGRGPGDS